MKPRFWYCNVCQAQNDEYDGECAYCECGGPFCQRDNCSDPRHFEHLEWEFAVEIILSRVARMNAVLRKPAPAREANIAGALGSDDFYLLWA